MFHLEEIGKISASFHDFTHWVFLWLQNTFLLAVDFMIFFISVVYFMHVCPYMWIFI